MSYLKKSTFTDESIKPNSYDAQIPSGKKFILHISSQLEDFRVDGYVPQSKNPKIITVQWLNDINEIFIVGYLVGNTSIHLKDKRNLDNNAVIKVTADYLFGKFIKSGDTENIRVGANDPTVRELIEDELNAFAQKRSRISYFFGKKYRVIEINNSLSSYNNGIITRICKREEDNLISKFGDCTIQHGFTVVSHHSAIYIQDWEENINLNILNRRSLLQDKNAICHQLNN